MEDIGDTQKAVHGSLTNAFRSEWADGFNNTWSAMKQGVAPLLPKLLDSLALSDVAARITPELGKLAKEFHVLLEKQRGSMEKADKFVREQVEVADKWIASSGLNRTKNLKHLNDLIYSQEYGATVYQVDPTKPQSDYKGRTDESGNDLEAVWIAQRDDWNALGGEGQKVYRTMRDMYRDLYLELKDAIFGRIDETLKDNPDAAAKLKKDVFAKLFEGNTLDVYFPLLREGRYKLSFQYKNGATENDKYVFQMFDNEAQRNRIADELKNNPDVITNTVKATTGDFTTNDFNNAPSGSFVKQVLDTLTQNGVDDTVQSEIMRLFIDTLPESSFAKSLQKRKGTPGYMTDAVYAMKSKGFDLARQVEKLKYNALIQNMEVQLNELEVPEDDFKFKTYRDEIKIRMKFAKYGANNKKVERYVRTFNQLAFVGTIGFNAASAMVQLAQTPMFTYMMLAPRYGYKKTYTEIMNAAGLVTGARGHGKTKLDKIAMAHGLDAYYDITDNGDFIVRKDKDQSAERIKELERLAPLVRLASERGHLSRSFIFDAMGLQEGGKARKFGKDESLAQNAASAIDFGTGVSAVMFNQAERFNRQVTMVATYNLALDRITTENPKMPLGERQNQAAQEALDDTQEYNGGSTLETAPRLAQEHVGRVALMYKSYGLRMYYTMIKTATELKDNFVETKKAEGLSTAASEALGSIAMKQIIGIHASALFFSGVNGLPLYGAVQTLFDLFNSDEEDDVDTIVRNYVGEGWYKGAFNQILAEMGLGADVASRVRLTGLLFQTNRYNADPSAEEFIGYFVGGPAWSVQKRAARGITDLYNGEITRGVESILPTGFSNMYKALWRYRREGGMYTRRNQPIYDDITNGELFTQLLGFAPAEYIRRQESAQALRRIDNALQDKRSNLVKKYYVQAQYEGGASIQETLKEILEFNQKHPSYRVDSKAIISSLNGHARSSTNTHYGTRLSPQMHNAMKYAGFDNGFTPP